MPPPSDATDHDAAPGRADLARPLADEIRRDRLIDVLAERWNVRLVTVIAPGGYGKSTALAQAIRDNDTDPSGVDAYARCRSSQPDAAAIARDLLTSLGADRRVGGSDIDRVVDAVVAAVSDASPNDVCLHVDDVHLAGDIDGAEDFLNGLLADLPFNGHLVLAGRSLPSIRTSRWRAADQVVDLDVGQLAFDGGELERLAARHGAHADEAAVADGWPALSRLALMVGSGVAREYLLEEVVDGLSESQRRGVAATVLAGAADDELLAAAGCSERGGQLVSQVPLLVELVDGSIGAHDLWHEVLPSLATDDELGAIVEAVVTRRSDRGDPIGAVEASLAARRWDLAQHLIGVALTFGDEELTIGRADRWLASFPTDERNEPRVRLLRAFRDRMAGDFPAATAEYSELLDVFAGADDLENETTATWELGVLCWLSGDREGYRKVEERSRSIVERGGTRMLTLGSAGRVARAELRGDFARALEVYEQNDRIDEVALRHRSSLSLLIGDDARARRLDALMLRHFPKPIVQGHARFTEWQSGNPAPMLEFRSRRAWDLDNRRNDFLVSVFEAMIGASIGRRPAADEIEALGWGRARERTFIALVWAAHDLFTGDEGEASDAFEARLVDIGVDEPLLRGEARRFLPYAYVLSPSMREWIESDETRGPLHERILAVARWFVGLRAGDDVGPPPATPPEFLAWLPLPWSVEIAARLAERGDRAGVELAEYLADVCGAASHRELRRVVEGAPTLKVGVDAILAVVPAPPSAPARITVSDATSVDFGDTHEVVTRQRVRQLLQMLVLRNQLTRGDVVDALWPDAEPAKGRSNLRATLLHLRRLLEPGRQAGEAAFHLRQRGERIWLQRSEMLACDAWDVANALAEADALAEAGRDDDAIEVYTRAVAMWPSGACADVRDIVQVAGDVEAIDGKVRRAACWVAERLLARGDRDAAVAAAAAVLERDEFDERAHGVLIAARLGDDDLAGARGAIDTCLARLRELGVRPSSGTAMLVKRYERRSGLDVA